MWHVRLPRSDSHGDLVGVAELGRDLQSGVPAADDQNRTVRDLLGVAVRAAVELGHVRGQRLAERRDDRSLERTGGDHDVSGEDLAIAGVGDVEVLVPPQAFHSGVQPGRDGERFCIVAQVVRDVVLAGVGARRSRERQAGESVVLAGGEQVQGVPAGTPRVADLRGGVDEQVGVAGVVQVVGQRQGSLAGSDDEDVDVGD